MVSTPAFSEPVSAVPHSPPIPTSADKLFQFLKNKQEHPHLTTLSTHCPIYQSNTHGRLARVCVCVCVCEWKSSPARWAPVITGWDSFLIILSNINPVGWCRPSCGLMDNVITARAPSNPHFSTHSTALHTRLLPLPSPSALSQILLPLSLFSTRPSHSPPPPLSLLFYSSLFSTQYFNIPMLASCKKRRKKGHSGSRRVDLVRGLLKMIRRVVGMREQ